MNIFPNLCWHNDVLMQYDVVVLGFARTLSSIYAIALLNALIKIQLSIVSRYVLADQKVIGVCHEMGGCHMW